MDTTMELFCTSVFPIWLPVKVKPPVIMLAQVLCVWEVYIPGVQLLRQEYIPVDIVHGTRQATTIPGVFRRRRHHASQVKADVKKTVEA
nr:unnamed protein product [Callosobruchus analis]